jgi:predicted RNA-binding protein associated with RNAse of E/G family
MLRHTVFTSGDNPTRLADHHILDGLGKMGGMSHDSTVNTLAAAKIHAPKVEIFDLEAMTNTDPKGLVRHVEEYRVEPFGLYMARPVVDHPRVTYFESWLLPEVGLRVSDWWWRQGEERDQDFYLDIANITAGRAVWRSVDHYLDVVVRTGRDLDVLDTDELLAATHAGLLDAAIAQRALEITYRTVDGIAAHDHDVSAWLATQGVRLSWRRH